MKTSKFDEKNKHRHRKSLIINSSQVKGPAHTIFCVLVCVVDFMECDGRYKINKWILDNK